MMFLENLRLAFSSLMANKMRAVLTMLGIIIGISAVIAIITVGNSLSASVTDSMSSLGANNVNIYLDYKEVEDEVTEEGYIFKPDDPTKARITEEDLISKDMIKELCATYPDEIYAVALERQVGTGEVTVGKETAKVNMIGANVGDFVSNNIEMTAGRFFTEQEMSDGRMLAIVSKKFVDSVYDGVIDDAVGENVNVYIGDKFYPVTIVGVYTKEESTMTTMLVGSSGKTTDMYIPLVASEKIAHSDRYQGFSVVTTAGVNADEFAKKAKSFFKTYYRNNKSLYVDAMSLKTVVEYLDKTMGSITSAISIVACIALLVGGIGVMNIMLVSITERTREIGTRKALGAPNSAIRMQFIIEAAVICIVGGIIGIILGVAAGCGLAAALGTPATPSVGSIILSLTCSMAIGIFFGYYPANKAAKMDPIEALRYE